MRRTWYRLPRLRAAWTLFIVFSFATTFAVSAIAQQAPHNDIVKAEHFLEKFETHVERMGGSPFTPTYDDKQALSRVRALMEAYPDDPEVQALFERARQALMASKGSGKEITPEMVAYKVNEERIIAALAATADEAWAAALSAADASGELIEASPVPDPLEVAADEVVGRLVVLEDIHYPENQFIGATGEFLFTGKPSQGFYYLSLSGRAWRSAYEAVRRYRREVTGDFPTPWTVIGRIVGLDMQIPDPSPEPTAAPALGWVVETVAIRIDGRTVAFPAGEGEELGRFAGEAGLESLKAEAYTVTDLPEDADPITVVTVLATAIKEKNWDLFLACLDDSWKATRRALDRARYYWDNNQDRYREQYVLAEPTQILEEIVISGERIDDTESFFLTEDEQGEVVERAGELVVESIVEVVRWDENGRQRGTPVKVYLRRTGDGPWRVWSGIPL